MFLVGERGARASTKREPRLASKMNTAAATRQQLAARCRLRGSSLAFEPLVLSRFRLLERLHHELFLRQIHPKLVCYSYCCCCRQRRRRLTVGHAVSLILVALVALIVQVAALLLEWRLHVLLRRWLLLLLLLLLLPLAI